MKTTTEYPLEEELLDSGMVYNDEYIISYTLIQDYGTPTVYLHRIVMEQQDGKLVVIEDDRFTGDKGPMDRWGDLTKFIVETYINGYNPPLLRIVR